MRNMKYAIVLSFLLSACGADQPVETDVVSQEPMLTATTPVDPIGADAANLNIIDTALDQIAGETQVFIRYDRVRSTKEGKNERQVFVEMLEASDRETEKVLTSKLGADGFAVRKGLDDEMGIRLQYKKAGVEPLNVLIRDKAASPPLAKEQAISSLYIRQTVL